HGLQHLGGGNHHLVVLQGGADDLLLQAGQFGVADLHAEIAAGHHHHVGGGGDFLEVGDGLGALDLGDDGGAAAGGPGQGARFLDVGGIAAEGYGDEVDVQAGGSDDVGAVGLGQRAQGQAAAEPVQAL